MPGISNVRNWDVIGGMGMAVPDRYSMNTRSAHTGDLAQNVANFRAGLRQRSLTRPGVSQVREEGGSELHKRRLRTE